MKKERDDHGNICIYYRGKIVATISKDKYVMASRNWIRPYIKGHQFKLANLITSNLQERPCRLTKEFTGGIWTGYHFTTTYNYLVQLNPKLGPVIRNPFLKECLKASTASLLVPNSQNLVQDLLNYYIPDYKGANKRYTKLALSLPAGSVCNNTLAMIRRLVQYQSEVSYFQNLPAECWKLLSKSTHHELTRILAIQYRSGGIKSIREDLNSNEVIRGYETLETQLSTVAGLLYDIAHANVRLRNIRTISGILRIIREDHTRKQQEHLERFAQQNARLYVNFPNVEKLTPEQREAETENLKIKILANEAELISEGFQMHHCIGQYGDKARHDGHLNIWDRAHTQFYYYSITEKLSGKRYTAEVFISIHTTAEGSTTRMNLIQLRGPHNHAVDYNIEEEFRNWMTILLNKENHEPARDNKPVETVGYQNG